MTSQKIVSLVNLANKRLNSSEDFEEFMLFVSQSLDLDTIYSLIDAKIDHEDGPKVLEYVLVGLSVKPDSQKMFEEVYEYVLNAMNNSEIPEKMKVCLISRLSLELNKLSTEKLIQFINMCKKDIEDSNENCLQSWKELIPQILILVSEIHVLTYDGLEMTGIEYKEMIITDICRCNVQTNIAIAIALMFRRTHLTEKEHNLVMKTLCSYFVKMKPQEIPPLLQQILHFCTSGDFLDLFCTLQKYFDDKYIQNRDKKNDVYQIENDDQKDLLEAESTVLFLLEDFAKVHPSFVNDITKYIKNSICAPNLIFGSFMLAFLLTISCCAPYENIVIDLVKKLVNQSLIEIENTKRSSWLKINYTEIFYVFTEFQVFIKSDISSYEKVFKGLVNLGLSFLGMTAFALKKNADIINKMHQLGLFIIVSLVHKRSYIVGSVLRKLTDFITSNSVSNQYLECLHKICKNQKSAVIEKNSELLRLFKEIPVGMTDKVTIAVVPVLKMSKFLRDNVIIILRKELMSKDYQLRHCAVLGFIEILCSVKLDSFTTLSQDTDIQDSWPGLFTQMVLDRNSVDIHSSADSENSSDNKSICIEILDILKTCFFQKAEIKQTLYRGLIRVASHNYSLSVCINSLVLDHMSSWCTRGLSDNKKSLKFEKSVVKSKSNEFILHEPLEELILLAQHILTTNIESENSEQYADELKILLDQLVNFYCDCNMDQIKLLNENDCLLDVISDVSQNTDVIRQILCVYQSFMVYIVNLWSKTQDKKCSETLQKLFFKYNCILEAIVASEKTSKKKDKAKKNKIETGITTKFTEPAIHLDFNVLYNFLSLLMKNVTWASSDSPLKQNVRMWEFVLKLVQTHLIEVKTLLSRDIKRRNLYENLCKLSKVLYDHFLFDISENLKFSPIVVELGIDCYLQVIKLVSSYYKKLDVFFLDSNKENSLDQTEEIFDVLFNVRSHLDKVLEMNQIDDSVIDDNVEHKATFEQIEHNLLGCVSVICYAVKQSQDIKIKNVLTWMSTVIEKYSFSNCNNSKNFLTLIIDMYSANQEDPIMLNNILQNLCQSFGQINKPSKTDQLQLKTFRFITTMNRTMICPVLCQSLCSELNYTLMCLSRIKAELYASQRKIQTICQDRLKTRERAICHRIILVILSTIIFTKTVIPLGQCTESVFNLLHQVYHTVNIVIKYFLARSSVQEPVYKQALLGKLFEIVNNQLTPNVSKFIIFVEHDRPLSDKEKNSVQLKNQTRRQTNYIPKVVIQLELFVNLITKLGKKCKDQNLLKNVKLTSSRDFRLNVQKLQDIVSKQNNSEDSEENSESETDQPSRKKQKPSSSSDASSIY